VFRSCRGPNANGTLTHLQTFTDDLDLATCLAGANGVAVSADGNEAGSLRSPNLCTPGDCCDGNGTCVAAACAVAANCMKPCGGGPGTCQISGSTCGSVPIGCVPGARPKRPGPRAGVPSRPLAG
jgi:hypothetical protein